ncbi:MAG: hypothetical protein ACFFBH_07310 [Promethearchaeota archaeon]
MAKKSIVGVVILVILWGSLMIIIPIQLLSFRSSLYDHINESRSFIYEPSSPSSIEKLYIDADEGNIEIRYINPPVDYFVLIDVNIALIGENLVGKSFDDYLNISWNNSSSQINLKLKIISDDWFNPLYWLKKEISIVVNIRKDIVFDIITNLTKGNFEITIPYGVSFRDLLTNVSNGNILYNFEHCSIQGNIIGTINNGNLIFKSNDVQYAQNSSWDINTREGNIDIEVFQYRDIGANTTGIFKVNKGDIFIYYKDNSADIGAMLEIPYGGEFMDKSGFPTCLLQVPGLICTLVDGFDFNRIAQTTYEGIFYFTSDDLLANIVKYYYNIRFEILEGDFDMDLTSIPSLFE